MKSIKVLCLFLTCLLAIPAISQNQFRVMFYNVENLFDTEDEPKKNDADFLPEGAKHWNNKRYYDKLNKLTKVISAAGEWDTPAIIGVCEIENGNVLNDLTKKTSLKNRDYRYVVTESPDQRGIDVGLLYQRDRFKLLQTNMYRIKFPYNSHKFTRDILHVTGEILSKDTLDIFVCHFPSRVGGEVKSEPDRMYVASIVRSKTDSLIKIRKNANILIMGDFNDEPTNRSIRETLGALPFEGKAEKNKLYNLFYAEKKEKGKESYKEILQKLLFDFEKTEISGSYKYQGEWNRLDQFLVSGSLLNKKQKLQVLPESALIFHRDFMLTDDTRGGKRPLKTYNGMKYEGGYSDHLPILIDFSF